MKTEYSQKLTSPKWQKKRLEIMQRDEFKCCYCSDSETELQIHHLKYNGEPWEAKNEDLITLCKHCHSLISGDKTLDVIRIEKIKVYENVALIVNERYKNEFITSVHAYEKNGTTTHLISFKKGSLLIKTINKMLNG